ncbi:MAG TPA: hypothetical protein VFR40_01960 [Lapillicoccus sp.]|nr:hypothetical protein [Lapillicoccus sp.]
MPSRRLTPDPDHLAINTELRAEPAQPSHGGLDVVEAAGEQDLATEPVLHLRNGDAPFE